MDVVISLIIGLIIGASFGMILFAIITGGDEDDV